MTFNRFFDPSIEIHLKGFVEDFSYQRTRIIKIDGIRKM